MYYIALIDIDTAYKDVFAKSDSYTYWAMDKNLSLSECISISQELFESSRRNSPRVVGVIIREGLESDSGIGYKIKYLLYDISRD